MKTAKILAFIPVLALLSASCDRSGGRDSGNVSFDVLGDIEITEVTRSSVSDYTALPLAGSFNIDIVDASSATVWSGLLSEYDSSTALKVGNYSVQAHYGEEGTEGFDKPCFSGKKDFAIIGGQTASVSIPVSLSNTIIRFACSEMFKKYFVDYEFTVSTGSGNVIKFGSAEKRAAFIEAYRFSVTGTMTTQSGETRSFSKDFDGPVEPATCYTLTFDVSNAGGLSIVITFNDSVETVDLGQVELND